jgi:hypothetical protein
MSTLLTDDYTTDKPAAKVGSLSDMPPAERKFFPSGAIAFFILLVILSLLFWYGIYFLMIERT